MSVDVWSRKQFEVYIPWMNAQRVCGPNHAENSLNVQMPNDSSMASYDDDVQWTLVQTKNEHESSLWIKKCVRGTAAMKCKRMWITCCALLI